MTSPYYQDEQERRTCECGCGSPVRRRFVSGHNRRGEVTSAEHRVKIAEAQRLAWETKRTRKPLGSRRMDVNGYWLIKVREGGGRWDKEHVLVMEQHIGRRLRPGEHVHHINAIRTDNRIDNLYLCADASEHAQIHATFAGLLPELISSGVVKFSRSDRSYRRA